MNDKESKKTVNTPDADLMWETVHVEHVIQDQWMDLRKVEYRFPDGSTFPAGCLYGTAAAASCAVPAADRFL